MLLSIIPKPDAPGRDRGDSGVWASPKRRRRQQMKLKKSLVAALCGAGLMGISAAAQATLFTFQPCGTAACPIANAATIDEAPGNGPRSGLVICAKSTYSGFTINLLPLDQSPDGNQYPGITTVTSSGAANLTLQVDTVNAGYFPDLLAGGFITVSLTNTSNITPFGQVNPSAQFSINGIANGGTPNNIGTINGLTGPNFQFQADANSSFQRTVPEPGTLTLLGLALAGMGGFFRRRSKA